MQLTVDKNIELQLLSQAHSEKIFQLVNTHRDYLKEWLPWLDETKSVNDTIAYIEKSEKLTVENSEVIFSILFQNEIVGQIGVHSINQQNKKAKIGYWLAPNFQGKGIVTKACKAIVTYCFEQRGLNRIEIYCATKNYKSQAIPERLQFKKEGILREAEWLYNKFVDHFLYSKLKSEWETNQ